MHTNSQIAKIEASQARQAKVRKAAFNLLMKFANSKAELRSKISNGDKLSHEEIDFVLNVAEEHHPIPDDKLELVFWALINPLVFHHFNQFGQELK